MRILLTSTVFHPRIGGIETIARIVAREIAKSSHDLVVLTAEVNASTVDGGYRIVHAARRREIWKAFKIADGVIQLGGLRLGWPLFLLNRPNLVIHQNFPAAQVGGGRLEQILRKIWLGRVRNVCPTRAFKERVPFPCDVVGNPYDDSIFHQSYAVPRDRDVAFLGRMVPEKGPDLLVEALGKLASAGYYPTTTFIGDGPELSKLQTRAAGLDLRNLVFHGAASGAALARILNQHRILVVPSRWPEPFGIVALEGMACGCRIIGSSGGGLGEAIGPGGQLFESGSVDALTRALENVLLNMAPAPNDAVITQHLQSHTARAVTGAYLQLLFQHR